MRLLKVWDTLCPYNQDDLYWGPPNQGNYHMHEHLTKLNGLFPLKLKLLYEHVNVFSDDAVSCMNPKS